MILRGIITGVLVLFIFSCTPKRIELPEKTIRAEAKGGFENSGDSFIIPDGIPAEKLFDMGYDCFAKGELEKALQYFETLVKRFPKDVHVSDSLYNAGLIYHKRAEYKKALEKYQQVIRTNYNNKDVLDAHFRILACLHELEMWKETLDRISMIETGWHSLNADDRVELAVRKGVALFGLKEYDNAKKQLLSAWNDYQIGLRKDEVINEFPGALAAYTLAMIEREGFLSVKLVLGEKQMMMELLEKKAQFLQNAQDWLMKCIAQDNAYWATAAGNQIGSLYHDFYKQISEVKTPEDLQSSPEEAEMYKCMLLDMVKVLLKKAMRIYGRTIEIGKRLRVHNKWTDKTENDLKKVEKLYLQDINKCEDVLPSEDELEKIKNSRQKGVGSKGDE